MAIAETIFGFVDVGIFILKWFWWVILLLIIFINKLVWKTWVMEVIIIEKRGDNLVKTNDRARKYVDSSGLVKYQLMKSKDTLPVINFNWVVHNNTVHTNFFERYINLLRPTVGTIFLFRYGSKQYKPINIKTKDGLKTEWKEIKDSSGQSLFINIYEQIDPRDKLKSLDFEVVDWDNMNFMVQEQRSSVERRKNNREKWMQIILPLSAIVLSAFVIIFMWYYGYQVFLDLKGTTAAPVTTPKADPNPNIPIIGNLVPGA